ncbi:MAG: acyl-ACP--UDP-N-acetylglucosamine O-acyltransferase [Gemmatimonadota bacterium]|nr:acyl-ACP--UDP-N-acetylglucosamine O-acyltransferase [Gemmatimonadota bacterium]
MSPRIHPTAIVHKDAELADDVEVGPWAYIGPDCTVAAGGVIQMRATLEEHVHLGPRVTVGIGSVLGGRPQDLKFKGEVTSVEIGEETTIREYVTVNRGTSESLKTTVGKKCFLMSYVHLAHDCHVGDGVIISNGTQLAGHVRIDERAIISGLCAVHQFAKVGRHSFIGGMSRVAKDIPPFVKAVGNPVKLYGLNSVGLQRSGFPEPVVAELKKAYRLFFRSDVNVTQAMERAPKELHPFPEVQALMAFVEESRRGIVI